MARAKRRWVSQDIGSFHIISRVAGGELLFNEGDKECFLKLLERFANGLFVEIHAFCIMSNHFHILATGLEKEAAAHQKRNCSDVIASFMAKMQTLRLGLMIPAAN